MDGPEEEVCAVAGGELKSEPLALLIAVYDSADETTGGDHLGAHCGLRVRLLLLIAHLLAATEGEDHEQDQKAQHDPDERVVSRVARGVAVACQEREKRKMIHNAPDYQVRPEARPAP